MKIIHIKYLSFLIFLFHCGTIFSQTNIDSLLSRLNTNKKIDTVRVNTLYDIATFYYKSDVEISNTYLDQAYNIADSIDYKRGKARGFYLKGKTQQEQFNYSEAINQYNKALLLYQELNDWESIANSYAAIGYAFYYSGKFNNAIDNFEKSIEIRNKNGAEEQTALAIKYTGYSFFDMGNYDIAQNYYAKALAINEKYGNKLEVSSCNLNIGSVYLKTGKYPKALEFYNNSLKISEAVKDTLGIAKALNNIGIIYDITKRYDQALKFYERAIKIQEKIGSKRNVAKGLGNLGLVYYAKKDYENALLHYNKAIKISKEINDRDSEARYLTYIGGAYMKLKDHSKSIKYYTKSEKVNIEIGDQYGLCYTYKSLADSYYEQKLYNKALLNAQKCNGIANKLKATAFQRESYELLAKIYEEIGNYKKALELNRVATAYKDSILNKENIEKIARLEIEYKYQKALDSASIRELQLTKTVTATNRDLEKSKRNYLTAIIGLLLLSIIIGGLIFYLKYKNIKSETQKIVIEQKLLRSQMTPHFIFNSLSVLQGMILNKEKKKSVSYLTKFSKLLRIILENSRDKMVSLSQELAAVENYLALQNLENNAYTYYVTVDNTVDVTLFEIPPMLIQPFIENAIEHAFENIKDNKQINVNLAFKDGRLICDIKDNGIGINSKIKSSNRDKNSLATIITSERLKIISNDFKKKGAITIKDRAEFNEQGTIVTIEIPYKMQNDL